MPKYPYFHQPTHQGEVLLRLEAEAQSDTSIRLRFSVEDTGIGIAADQLEELFDKFTQADASTTRQYGGSGLGLAICKELVELMGGTIHATSQLNQGSSFWFILTLEVDSKAPAVVPPIDLAGIRGLIVDDNATNRQILEEQNSSWGMRTSVCASGMEAIDALQQADQEGDPYRIALIDYQMPQMDGRILAQALKTDPVLKKTVLVMLSSVGAQAPLEALQEIGIAACLTKPVRPANLMDTMMAALGVQREQQALADVAAPAAKRPTLQDVSFEGTHVLVVEDNIINQKVAAGILQSFGCKVVTALNGREALEALEANPYDLIFMDCQMPEMDGYQATQAIRQREGETRHTPIVAMTAHALPEDRDRCLAAGMDDYISKPVSQESLKTLMMNHLEMGKGMVPIATAQAVTAVAEDLLTLDNAKLEALKKLEEGGHFSLPEYIDLFHELMPPRIVALKQAVVVDDSTTLKREAHTIKGGSRDFGAERLAELCQRLEDLETIGEAPVLIDAVEREFEAVKTALGEYLS